MNATRLYKLLFTPLFALAFCSQPQAVLAEDLICPAVYACDGQGNVLDAFKEGPCGARFAKECALEVANDIADEFIACDKDRNALLIENQKQENIIKRLKRQNKRLKKSRKK